MRSWRIFAVLLLMTRAVSASAETSFPAPIKSVLDESCFDCHANGAEEGGLSFDKLTAGDYGDETQLKWVAIWKNVRAETMPPPGDADLATEKRARLIKWIESDIFRLDPNNVDPGVVTIRRLNREEYRNSVREVFGVHYDVNEEFPADDTGYGFDTIGDVLNMSPVLFEKYLAAAEEIADEVVPLDGPQPPEQGFWTDKWKGSGKPDELSLEESNIVRATRKVAKAGPYRVHFDYELHNSWTRLTETAAVVLRVIDKDGQGRELARHEAGWMNRSESHLSAETDLSAGETTFEVEIIPIMPHGEPADPATPKDLRYKVGIRETKLIGPLNGELSYRHPASTVFFDGPPPSEANKREQYAREILRQRARLAFRRPVEKSTLDYLTRVAITEMQRPGQRFEHGIKASLKLILASPLFLFRSEGQPHPDDPSEVVELDEFELASRMAFFLWSSVPDRHLHEKAAAGTIRENLDETIDWMWQQDWRCERFVRNFVGQWLQLRDIHSVDSNERLILGRKHPLQDELRRSRYQVRDAMRRETEALFKHLIDESRPIEELLTARYTYLNRYTAKAYGIDGIGDRELKRVELDAKSNRRGLLTHGSILLVTSNPTRTSPVKRGLFILENLLGTPSPPPPPDVPALEEVTSIDIHKAPLRKVLEAHRESPECASCHQRMDPLGLALEHFDALGMYRDVEPAREAWRDFKPVPERPIDVSGQLLTGEKFETLDELIDILSTTRKRDLYRCLTEKMMTYALGRGIEYTDAPTIDLIVDRVEADGGSMRTLIREIIKSKPFQYRRGAGPAMASN